MRNDELRQSNYLGSALVIEGIIREDLARKARRTGIRERLNSLKAEIDEAGKNGDRAALEKLVGSFQKLKEEYCV
jgi:hypothetical protein